ncbi:MAG: hypothetical protein LBR18_05940 [Tannerella sp.]|jgi:hypothetical protein|nr:hypothetical protein [Tannerella sp.]
MNKLLFNIIIISALFTLPLRSYAQDEGRRRDSQPFDREAFMEKRNKFIVEKTGLTAEETAVFIPLENELMRKKFEVGRDCHRLERALHNKKERTQEEYQRLLACREEVKEKRDGLDKEYLEKFKKILTAEQICKYQSADRAFFDEFFRDRGRQEE